MASIDSSSAHARLDALDARLAEVQAGLKSLRAELDGAAAPEPEPTPESETSPSPLAAEPSDPADIDGQVLSRDDIAALLTTYSAAADGDETSAPPTQQSNPAAVPTEAAASDDLTTTPVEPKPEPDPGPAFTLARDAEVEPDALTRVPAELAVSALALPVCVRDGVLHCLVATPWDAGALDQVREAAAMPVEPHPADLAHVVARIRATYSESEPAAPEHAERSAGGWVARLRSLLPRRAA